MQYNIQLISVIIILINLKIMQKLISKNRTKITKSNEEIQKDLLKHYDIIQQKKYIIKEKYPKQECKYKNNFKKFFKFMVWFYILYTIIYIIYYIYNSLYFLSN